MLKSVTLNHLRSIERIDKYYGYVLETKVWPETKIWLDEYATLDCGQLYAIFIHKWIMNLDEHSC